MSMFTFLISDWPVTTIGMVKCHKWFNDDDHVHYKQSFFLRQYSLKVIDRKGKRGKDKEWDCWGERERYGGREKERDGERGMGRESETV